VPGQLYTYQWLNQSIVHRHVACLNDCTSIVINGDNNRVAEIVPRTAIKLEVVGGVLQPRAKR
jgi:hypothetical protein